MQLAVVHDVTLQKVAKEEIIVHSLGDDPCHGLVLKLDESVVLGSAGLSSDRCRSSWRQR
jgi:hypothetical protein